MGFQACVVFCQVDNTASWHHNTLLFLECCLFGPYTRSTEGEMNRVNVNGLNKVSVFSAFVCSLILNKHCTDVLIFVIVFT